MKVRVLVIILFSCIILLVASFLTKSFWINKYTNPLEQTAKDYLQDEQYSQAEKTYKTITKEYPRTDDLKTQRDLIFLYIESGNFQTAEETIDELINNFSEHPDLPETLFLFTERCEWVGKFEEAERICQKIIQRYPETPHASKAALSIAKGNIMSLIISGDYVKAELTLNKMVADFTSHKDLPDTLYWIAERYRLEGKYDEAKNLYNQIVQNYPSSPYARRAKLGITRAEVLSLIASEKYDQADEALDELVADFADHQDLAETLHLFTEKYEYARKFEEAKHVYRQIIQNCPDSSYADRAKLGIIREEIMSLIFSENYAGAEKALNKMVSDFSGHPDLPDTLYWIAERYRWSGKYEEAKNIYQEIMQNYPGSTYALKASKGFLREEVLANLVLHDYNQADEILDKLIANSPKDSDLSNRLYLIATALQEQERYEEAIKVADKGIAVGVNNTTAYPTDHNYYLKGFCYYELENYEEALKWYDKLIIELPNSDIANDARMQAGRILYFQGKYKESVDAFRSVLYNEPSEALAKEAKQNIEDIERLFLKKQ
jgi:TolA-binding protein